jgi:hypothetical protein
MSGTIRTPRDPDPLPSVSAFSEIRLNSWNGSWTGCGAQPVRRVQSGRPGVQSVQVARTVRLAVFLVMNRSSVRFRRAALPLLVNEPFR